ncbi:PCBP2 protein, partial [Rhinoptilus africanus]|nr:PCBP2 protein [Rhinoptilus africanus]
MDTGVIEGGLNVTLTIRLLMHGKVGGRGPGCGASGARINISEGNCPERIITLAGPTNAIFKAFAMIIDKLEEGQGSGGATSPWVRSVVPKWLLAECRNPPGDFSWAQNTPTGAQVQVAGDMLPNSTERAITIAGIPQSIIECVKQICVVMLESPPKGVTIPYRPKPSSSPVIFAGGQKLPFSTPGEVPAPALRRMRRRRGGVNALGSPPAANQAGFLPLPQLIGCIIGRQGAKINEIRQMSGAQIKIANPVEGSTDRQVTITGSAASISLAQYLI